MPCSTPSVNQRNSPPLKQPESLIEVRRLERLEPSSSFSRGLALSANSLFVERRQAFQGTETEEL